MDHPPCGKTERLEFMKRFNSICHGSLLLMASIIFFGCATTTRRMPYAGGEMSPNFDGVYYAEYKKTLTMYLKFFEDGHVISANLKGTYDNSVKNWLDSTYTKNVGTWSVSGNKITFFVESTEGRVEYSGVMYRGTAGSAVREMDLKLHSLINQKESKFTFHFSKGEK